MSRVTDFQEPLRGQELLREYDFLVGMGVDHGEVLRRLGVKPGSLERALDRRKAKLRRAS